MTQISDSLKKTEERINKLLENDLPHIRLELEGLKTDAAWIKKSIYLVASSSIGAFFTALANLFR